MGHMKRTLDLKGNRLPPKSTDTTAQIQEAMEAQGINTLPPDACAPATATPKCPTCRGFGHVITDVVNGAAMPCPVCSPIKSEYKPIFADTDRVMDPYGNIITAKEAAENGWSPEHGWSNVGVDSKMPLPDPTCKPAPPLPADAISGREFQELVEKAREEIMKSMKLTEKALGKHEHAMTATEVAERQRYYEQKALNHAKNYGMKDGKIGG